MRFADSAPISDSTTNQLEATPTYPRAWRIKRRAPIPETPTPLAPTLMHPLHSTGTHSGNKKAVTTVGSKTVRFSFIERAVSPNGEVSESVISFNDSETNPCDEYWKPGALDDRPYIMNCRTTR